MFLRFRGIRRKGNLRRRPAHVQEAIRAVLLAVVVVLRLVKPTQQVVCRDPAVQALCLARNDLHMDVAVWQLKSCALFRELAHLPQYLFSLYSRQYTHACCREQK